MTFREIWRSGFVLRWRARLKFERKLFLIGRSIPTKHLEYLFPTTVENEVDKDNG